MLFCSKTLSYNICFGVALLSRAVSHASELSFPLSSKMCGHLQPGAAGAGLLGSSAPFTLFCKCSSPDMFPSSVTGH